MGAEEIKPLSANSRLLASAGYFLPLLGFGIIGPLVIYLFETRDKFVRFHAFQSFIFQLFISAASVALFLGAVLLFFLLGFGSFAMFSSGSGPTSDAGMLQAASTTIVLMMLGMAVIGILAIAILVALLYQFFVGVKALSGDLFKIPYFGKLSLSKI